MGRRASATPRPPSRPAERALAVVGAAGAVALAFVVVHRSPPAAGTLALAPLLAWLLTRSYGGLALGLVLVLALPYWWTVGTAQATVLRLAALAAATGLLFAHRLRPCLTDVALAALLATILLAWVLVYPQPHVGRVVSIELTPLGFYFGARALPGHRLPLAMNVILIGGTLGALSVLYELWQGHAVFVDPLQYQWNATDSSTFRPGGVFGSPPGAGTVLSFVVLFGLPCLAAARGRRRALAASCLIVCSAALIATFTRADIVATALGLLVYLCLTRSSLLRPLRVAWFAVAVAGLVVLLLPRLQTNSTFQEAIVRPGNLTAREGYWNVALPITTANAHNLIVGVGTGSLEVSLVSNEVPIPSELAASPEIVENSLHNQYLTTLFEQGLLGLAALLLFLLAPLFAAVKAALTTRDPCHAAIAASIVSMAIVMSVDTALLHGPSFAMILVATGFAASGAQRRSSDPRGGSRGDSRPARGS